jgi:hypothetical protein
MYLITSFGLCKEQIYKLQTKETPVEEDLSSHQLFLKLLMLL